MALTLITPENFNKEVKQSDIPVIIDFYADWCGPCKMMGPVFEKLSGSYTGKMKFAKVDTEAHQELAQEFGITGIPCLVVTKKGEEVGRIVGFRPEPALKAEIDKYVGK